MDEKPVSLGLGQLKKLHELLRVIFQFVIIQFNNVKSTGFMHIKFLPHLGPKFNMVQKPRKIKIYKNGKRVFRISIQKECGKLLR